MSSSDGSGRAAKRARLEGPAQPPEQLATCRCEAAAWEGELAAAQNPLLDVLPPELLTNHVLPLLEPTALCALLATCTGARALLTDPCVDDQTWGVIARCLWESPLLLDAVKVAGSFRAYAIQKKQHMQQGVAEWKTPCEFEMQASLLRIAAAATATPPASPSLSPRAPAPSSSPCTSCASPPAPAPTLTSSAMYLLNTCGNALANPFSIRRSSSGGSDGTQIGAPSTPDSPGGSLLSAASVGSVGSEASGSSSQGPSAHILFLLDGSGSVGDEEFTASTSFIARAAADAKMRSNRPCKVVVMQFSNDVRTEWEDGSSACTDDIDAFKATIQSMVRMNGGTNIAAALSHAGKVLKRDAGADVAKVIVLITDGRVDGYQAKEARHVAAMLADEQPHTTMFAYGVGRGVDRAELLSIIGAARPYAGSAYHAPEARYLDLFHREEAPW